MLFQLQHLQILVLLFCAVFAVLYWRVKRTKGWLGGLNSADLPQTSQKVRNSAVIFGLAAVSGAAALYQILRGYTEAQRRIDANPYIDHLAGQSSISTPKQSWAQAMTLLILIATVVVVYLAIEKLLMAFVIHRRLRPQSAGGWIGSEMRSGHNVVAQNKSGVSKAVLVGGVAALLLVVALFHVKKSGAISMPPPGTATLPATSIHTTATAGLWFTEVGGSAEDYREVSIDVDDAGTPYLDPTDNGLASVPLTANVWNNQEPHHFLVIEKVNIEQWQNGVRAYPGQRTVRVVQALCKQGIPVAVFQTSELQDANEVAYSDACTAVRGSPTSPASPTAASTPNSSPAIQQPTGTVPNSSESQEMTGIDENQPGFRIYQNSRFGFTIDYPQSFIAGGPPENGDGLGFVSPDRSAKLDTYGSNNSGDDVASAYNAAMQATKATYHNVGGNWFVISWTEGPDLKYQKTFVGKGSTNTFIFSYPRSQRMEYDPIAATIEKSFRPGDIDQSR